MKKRNKAIVEMYAECEACLERNAGRFAGNVPLEVGFNSLQTRIGIVNETMAERDKNIKGFAVEKHAKLLIMANLTDVMRMKTQSVYLSHNDELNFVNANYTLSDLLYTSAVKAIGYAKQVLAMARAVDGVDRAVYLITDDDIEQLENAITKFSETSTARRSSAVIKQTTGDVLEDLIKSTSVFIRTVLTNLVGVYKLSDPSFFMDWEHSKTIINPAQNHGQITGEVKDAVTQQPLQMVKVIVTDGETTYEDMTDRFGKFKVPVSPEIWNVSFELPSYIKKEVDNLAVESGERQKVNVLLSPASG